MNDFITLTQTNDDYKKIVIRKNNIVSFDEDKNGIVEVTYALCGAHYNSVDVKEKLNEIMNIMEAI